MIKLRCVSAPKNSFLFTVNKVYDKAELSAKNNLGGTLKVTNDKGRNDFRGFKFTKDKDVYSGGYIFKIMLVPVIKSNEQKEGR